MSTELARTSTTLPDYAKDETRPYEGDPWSRQPQESPKAFEAFKFYLGLPADDRTQAAAFRLYKEKYGVDSAGNQWAKKHRWAERALAYDNFLMAKEVAIHARQRIHSATKHAKQAAEIQEVLMLPMTKLRERIKAQGDSFGFIDGMTDEELAQLARQFASDVPRFQIAERDALNSTATTVVPRAEVKAKGEVVRRLLMDPTLRALAEKVSFEIEASVPLEPDQ